MKRATERESRHIPKPTGLVQKCIAEGKKMLAIKNRKLFIFCIVIAALFSLSPKLRGLSFGLDPSYLYGVNKAGADGLSFGDQFISTYGPLGYLIANYLPDNIAKVSLWWVAYSAAVGTGIYAFCAMYLADRPRKWLAALVLLYAFGASLGASDVSWTYLLVFLLYCFLYLKMPASRRPMMIVGLAIVAGVFSLAKFTLGLGSLLALLALCGFDNRVVIRERTRLLGLAGAVYVLSFVGLGLLMNINDFVAYIRSARILSANFGSAMSYFDPETAAATWLTVIVIALIIAWPLREGRSRAIRYAFLLPPLYILWQYCVSRQDQHLEAILQAGVPLALLFYFSRKERTQRDMVSVMLVIFFASLAMWANKLAFHQRYAFIVTAPITNIKDGEFISFFKIGQQKRDWTVQGANQLAKSRIPDSMRAMIGGRDVDVFPWEASVIAANNLKWNNRPSPFSFQSFDPYFDNANADFLASGKAPQFIIWHSVGNTGIDGLDGRHILWDEPRTVRTILAHYEFIENNDKFMLLKKRQTPLNMREEKIAARKQDLSQGNVTLPETQGAMILARIDVKKGLSDKIVSQFIRGKQYYITLQDTRNKNSQYRFVPENGSQGILVGCLPKNWDDLIQLMQGQCVAETTTRLTMNGRLGSVELTSEAGR